MLICCVIHLLLVAVADQLDCLIEALTSLIHTHVAVFDRFSFPGC